MARTQFTILGNRVQNVGYRLFLLQAMKEKGIVGIPSNLGGGKAVHVRAWGDKKAIQEFYDFIKTEKPKGTGLVEVSPAIIDNVAAPGSTIFLNEKMDLMIENTSKFAQEGHAIKKELKAMPKKIGKEVSAAIKQN